MLRSKLISLFCSLILLIHFSFAQTVQPDPSYRLRSGKNYVQTKNYYLLTLFQELPEVKKLLASDPFLAAMGRQKIDSVNAALKTCGRNGLCYTNTLRFSETAISQVAEKLKALYQPNNVLGKLVKDHLIPSGCYILFQQLPPAELLAKAWMQDAAGINFAIGVYAEGRKPNYPLIDSISFKTRDPRDSTAFLPGYLSLLHNATYTIAQETKSTPAFFEPSLTAALRFIEINEREQAADFEPMTEGENKAAYERVKSIKWDNYKYSVIMLPGAGPDDPAAPLSAEGMLRCRLAVIQYHAGAAPFIVPSGGRVHPYKTKYCEATEMKKFLIEKLGVPANAIIIDPHARHTTTNMRNTVRLMFRYGIPMNKMGISCTTRGQSSMIEKTLIDRCLRELGEAPYKNGSRLTETEVEFYPLLAALHINPKEPMDP